jgi:adhesin transport system outer membrane protein
VARKAWYPTLDVTAFYGFEEQRKKNADNTHLPTREVDFKLTQLLYDFGSTGIGTDQAGLAVSQAEVILDTTEQGLILEAVSAYLGLISANEIVNFAKGSEANIKRQTELEDARVQRGSGFSTDVLQAKAQLAGAQARRVQAVGALQQARYRYQAVFGVMPEKIAGLKKPRVPLDLLPGSMEDAVELALKNSKQLEVTKIISDIARSQTKKARADGLFPVVNLIGENKLKRDVAGTPGFKGEQIVRVEATYSFNLWGASLNTIEASKHAYLASESRVMDAKTIVAEQVRAAWQQLETSRENAQFLRNQANIASEFLELARKERRLGRRSLIDVLAGETALINASSDASSADNAISTAAFTLLGVMGNLHLDAIQ